MKDIYRALAIKKNLNNFFKFIVFNLLRSSNFRQCLIRKILKISTEEFYISEGFKCSLQNFHIGEFTFINSSFRCLGFENAKLEIGSYTQISNDVTIILGSHELKSMAHTSGDVIIGNQCWIGARVTILPSLKIGDGAVVGAGAVVTKDVPPFTVVAGVPARYLKDREVSYPYHLARPVWGVLNEDGSVTTSESLNGN